MPENIDKRATTTGTADLEERKGLLVRKRDQRKESGDENRVEEKDDKDEEYLA